MPITATTESFAYSYYSGASIGLWMSDALITDAVGVEFSLSQLKRPVWGYASSLYDGVASGIVQVSGTLFINFIQPQTLPALVQRALGGSKTQTSGISNISSFLGTLDYTENIQLIEQLKNELWGLSDTEFTAQGNLGTASPIPISLGRPDQHYTGFEILITYGPPFQSDTTDLVTNSTIRKLKGVHIVGFGQQINVDGEVIIEAYPFIAREVV